MNIKQKIYDLKASRAETLEAAKGLLEEKKMDDWKAKMAEVDGFNDEIAAYEKMLGEGDRFGDPASSGPQVGKSGEGEDDYTKAVKSFAAAFRSGFPATKAAGDQMQEGVNADGGYIVPQDIVTKIISQRESKESLLGEVRVVNTKTNKGRRTIKKRGQHKGFTTTAEAAKIGKMATPQFDVIEYEIEKRNGYLPVTTELYEDSDTDVAAFLVEWLGDEARVTANKEIVTIAKSKGSEVVSTMDDILRLWVGLGKVFRATSKLITNADGLLWLGTLKDKNDRYLLTPNPADPQQLQLCVGPYILPVKDYDNDTIPSDGTKIPLILGDLKEGICYWDRRRITTKKLDQAVIGDFNAAEQDLILIQGSLRDDCTLWDSGAFVYCEVDTAATAAAGVDTGDETDA